MGQLTQMLGQLGRTRIDTVKRGAQTTRPRLANQLLVHTGAAVVKHHLGTGLLQARHHLAKLGVRHIGFERQVSHQGHTKLLTDQADIGQVRLTHCRVGAQEAHLLHAHAFGLDDQRSKLVAVLGAHRVNQALKRPPQRGRTGHGSKKRHLERIRHRHQSV